MIQECNYNASRCKDSHRRVNHRRDSHKEVTHLNHTLQDTRPTTMDQTVITKVVLCHDQIECITSVININNNMHHRQIKDVNHQAHSALICVHHLCQ